MAASTGQLQMVQWLLTHHFQTCPLTALETAARTGHLQVVQCLWDHQLHEKARQAMETAARAGHLEIVQYLWSKQLLDCTEGLVEHAVRGGHFAIVTWLATQQIIHKDRPKCCSANESHLMTDKNIATTLENCVSETRDMAVNGRMQAFEWLVERFPQVRVRLIKAFVAFASEIGDLSWLLSLFARKDEWEDQSEMGNEHFERALKLALHNGHLDVVEFFIQRQIVPMSLHDAVAHGHVHLVSTLRTKYKDADWSIVDRRSLLSAARLGHVDMVRFLDPECREAYSVECFHNAATSGNVAMLALLSQSRADLDVRTWRRVLKSAIKMGQLATVQFIVSRMQRTGGDLTMVHVMTEVFDAAGAGHFHVISYLVHRLPLGECDFTVVFNRAAFDRHLALIQLLHEQKACGDVSDAMNVAASVCSLRIVRFLHEQRDDCCARFPMDYAAAGGSLRVVQYLHHRRPGSCTTNAMDYATRHGHLKVVQFLHENRSEGCTKAAMDDASRNGHLYVVRFLYANRDEGWSSEAVRTAAKNNHFEVVQFLLTHGNDWSEVQLALSVAREAENWDIVQWIHDQGFAA